MNEKAAVFLLVLVFLVPMMARAETHFTYVQMELRRLEGFKALIRGTLCGWTGNGVLWM